MPTTGYVGGMRPEDWRTGVARALPGQYLDYTNQLTATTTNPTGWTTYGRWLQIGPLVTVQFRFTAGTSMTTGTGTYRMVLPVTARFGGAGFEMTIGQAEGYDASANTTQNFIVSLRTATAAHFGYPGVGAPTAAATTPWTWAAGDVITGTITYEAALPT